MGAAPAKSNGDQRSVGHDLAKVLPKTSEKWYTKRHLVLLNFCLFSLILFCKKSRFCYHFITNQLHSFVQWL